MVDWARFTPSDFEYDEDADHLGSHGALDDRYDQEAYVDRR